MRELTNSTIGVIGLGQIGGSLAAALGARVDATVIGCDSDSGLVQKARDQKIVAETCSCDDLVARAEIVVLATPQTVTPDLLRHYADALGGKKLVVDAGSLKTSVCALAAELALKSFVGGHPRAGSEKRGADAWNRDLFVNASFLLCPTDLTADSARQLGEKLAEAVGSEPQEIDPETHDRLFALTSGLPHAVAVALGRLFEAEAAGQKIMLIGPSFRSATRVAGSDPELIRHLLHDNRVNVAERLDKLIAILAHVRDSLRDNDLEALDKLVKD